MTLELLPLPGERFDVWRAQTRTRMIRLRQDSGLHPGADAAVQTDLYFAELLPDGLRTPTSRVLRLVDDHGPELGTVWIAFRSGRMFLIDVTLPVPLGPEQNDDLWALLSAVATAEQVSQISAGVFPHDVGVHRLLDGRGFTISSIEMLLEPLPVREDGSSVDVSPMTPERYPRFAAASEAGFAAELVASGRLTADEAAAEAHRQFQKELPDGLETPGQELFTATVDGAEVGILWLAVRERDGHPHVFVLDIEVAEGQRRRGYGRALMQAAEGQARRVGADSVGLHVFGFNGAAVALYEELGYRRVQELLVLDR